MLEPIQNLPTGLYGLRATGTVSKDDYEQALQPLLEEARREGRRIRFLYLFAPEFKGFTMGGAWEDARIGLHYLRLFERCAVVSDVGWIRGAARIMGAVLPCPVRVFGSGEWQEAIAWLSSPPNTASLTHRLFPEQGVLVVEPHGRLHIEDFDALALMVDPWIEAHGVLNGLVVHVYEFPGWESVGSFLRHIRFIRDHHRKIRRVAVAADSKLAKLGSGLAEHFVQAEIRRFDYSDVDQAIAWAGRPPSSEEVRHV